MIKSREGLDNDERKPREGQATIERKSIQHHETVKRKARESQVKVNSEHTRCALHSSYLDVASSSHARARMSTMTISFQLVVRQRRVGAIQSEARSRRDRGPE